MKLLVLAPFIICMALPASMVYAATPLWTFTPTTSTAISLGKTETKVIGYRITNQSRKRYSLALKATPGIQQLSGPGGECAPVFVLGYKQSCLLRLEVDGSKIQGAIQGGPVVCDRDNALVCYQPEAAGAMRIAVTEE